MMQVFNSVTCRSLDFSSLNPFRNLCNNSLFWLVQAITVAVQYAVVQWGGDYVGVVPLTWQQHLMCLACGPVSILVGVAVKLVPDRCCSRIELFKNREIREENMDMTLSSRLRKRSTLRLHTSSGGHRNSIIRSVDELHKPSQLAIIPEVV